ncbi:MAG: filamentous hemagglutinin N-terminal domain-containing protein [Planctomycetota bacterium]
MKIRSTRLLLAASLCCYVGLSYGDIQPTGATNGVVFDNATPNVTNITAPDNAIIDYAAFNVGSNQTVNFLQPNAAARVLNRINSNAPTQIDGTIHANGIVYLVNPAGVTFGPNSIVDAAGIFAAAGSLSNSDFLSGINQFTAVTGDVQQHGVMRADTIAALIGRNVNNTGTITVPNGTAVLASGDSVLIGNPLGGLMVSVDATPNVVEGSVNDNGSIDADQVSLVSGDLFSLAIAPATTTTTGEFRPDVTIADIDTDGDGDIDNDDVNTAFSNFTGPLAPGTGGKTQQQGDTDGDGDVDNTDIGTLFIFFTGPITPIPPDSPAPEFDLSTGDLVERLPAIGEEVNLTEADLGILRDQLGIAARQPLPGERLEKAEARALYDDLRARSNAEASPDGSLVIANTRLDADVVRQALAVYRERLAAEGVTPAERSVQVREAVDAAHNNYVNFVQEQEDDGFNAEAFGTFVRESNPALFDSLAALNELNRLTSTMGLNELEKQNSEQTIVNRSRPEALTFEQMKATLEAAEALSLAETEVDAG